MSIKLRKRIEECMALSRRESSVLSVLAHYAIDDGRDIWPSVATIAKRTKFTARWVYSTLRLLRERGLLVVERASTPTSPTHYRIDLAVLDELCSQCHTSRASQTEVQEQNAPGELRTPGEADADIGGTRRTEPGEAKSPKGSVEDSPTNRAESYEDLEAEVDRRFQRAIIAGRQIDNKARYRNGIKRNIQRDSAQHQGDVPAASSSELQLWVDGIDDCFLCVSTGWIQVRDRSSEKVETTRCTHHKETYEGAEILTASVA